MTQPTRTTSPDPVRLLASALRLAAYGIAVFPCAPDAKRPLTRHGLLDATTDAGTIRDWWRRHPRANIAMPTGVHSHDVLDVDVHQNGSGYTAYNRLVRAGLVDSFSRLVITPSGGLHAYFTGTQQPSSSLPAHHLDLKATGGYVLVPPSVVDGRPYELIRRSNGPHQRLDWQAVRNLIAPAGAARLAPERVAAPVGIEPLARWVARLPEGRRNAGTFWAACRAVEQGFTDLHLLIDAAVEAGLPHVEATRTVHSATRSHAPASTQATSTRLTPPRSRGAS